MGASLQVGSFLVFTPLCDSLPPSVCSQAWSLTQRIWYASVWLPRLSCHWYCSFYCSFSWITHSGVRQLPWCETPKRPPGEAPWRGIRPLANYWHQFASRVSEPHWKRILQAKSSFPMLSALAENLTDLLRDLLLECFRPAVDLSRYFPLNSYQYLNTLSTM